MWFPIFIPLLVLLLLSETSSDPVLYHAAIVFRHGHRTPLNHPAGHPKKPPKYFGQLSTLGQHQGIALGRRLAKFYTPKMFYDKITPDMVRVRSSNTPRTIRTGKLFVNALTSTRNENVSVIPGNSDFVISSFAPCRKYEEEFVNLTQSPPPEHVYLLFKYRERLQRLTPLVGTNLNSVAAVQNLYDRIMCETMGNIGLPRWSEEVYPDGLAEFVGAKWRTFTYTPYMLKAKSGPLISEIRNGIGRFEDFYTETNIPFDVYSGHDITLMNLARALNLEGQLPMVFNFTSALAIEVYRDSNNQGNEFVEFRFFDLDKDPLQLFLEGCHPRCSLTQFMAITEPMAVENPDVFCNNTEGYQYSTAFKEAAF